MNTRWLQNTLVLVLAFLSFLIILYWPSEQTAAFHRPNQLDLGFTLTLLLTFVFVTLISAKRVPQFFRVTRSPTLDSGILLTLELVAVLPLGLLLNFAGILSVRELILVFSAGLAAIWAFLGFVQLIGRPYVLALLAAFYMAAVTGQLFFYGLDWPLTAIGAVACAVAWLGIGARKLRLGGVQSA